MSPEEIAARCAVIETARAMSRQGLSPSRSGNISQRWGRGLLITPSGMAYAAIDPDVLADLRIHGAQLLDR